MAQFTPLFALKDKMARAGIKVAQMAAATGYDYQYVSQILNGHARSPKAEAQIRKMVRVILRNKKVRAGSNVAVFGNRALQHETIGAHNTAIGKPEKKEKT